MSGAYYNEFDMDTAAWLEELIRRGLIASGQVDTRSIEDVRPDDLRGFTQCHFFAGIGVWSYALRSAGWPDDRPVWTGSCPCQPFSAAGKGAAFADERHLWPAFHHLIKERHPATVFGEQVASSAIDDWIDLVHADLEALGYAFGSIPFPSAGVGAPHIRDRNYWVGGMANANDQRLERRIRAKKRSIERAAGSGLLANRLADANGSASEQGGADIRGRSNGSDAQPWAGSGRGGMPDGLADAHGGNAGAERQQCGGEQRQQPQDGGLVQAGSAGPTNGYWSDADWLGCRDGKWRPVEPGTFPLVNGASARVVRLRGYGNAINSKAAQAWIETVMECIA